MRKSSNYHRTSNENDVMDRYALILRMLAFLGKDAFLVLVGLLCSIPRWIYIPDTSIVPCRPKEAKVS